MDTILESQQNLLYFFSYSDFIIVLMIKLMTSVQLNFKTTA